MKAPYPEHRAVYFHSPKRDNPEAETVYTENLEKAAQTADLLLGDLRVANSKASTVAERKLLDEYVRDVYQIKVYLERMAAEKTQLR